jgi:hypothetical protein
MELYKQLNGGVFAKEVQDLLEEKEIHEMRQEDGRPGQFRWLLTVTATVIEIETVTYRNSDARPVPREPSPLLLALP